jgi:carotenoid cleavage dioxygenase
MVHTISFGGGRAVYRNRYVRTPTLAAEEKAGRALWGGVLMPIAPSADEVGPGLAQKPFRDMPDINVVRHGGRLLALAEGDTPFTLSEKLDTAGPWDFSGALRAGMCAHPKIDPVTGEMIVFRYGLERPFLDWAVVGADGAVTRPPETIEIDAPYMIHDCAITEQFLVLFVCPLRFDFEAEDVLAWEPKRGTRIAVIRRDAWAAKIRWFQTEAFWVWHFANAYEEGSGDDTRIVVHYPYWSHPGFDRSRPATGGIHRTSLHPGTGVVSVEQRFSRICEFPRIDDRRLGRAHRYFHAAAKDPDAPGGQGVWNGLIRYDLHSGAIVERRMDKVAVGEAVFAPGTKGNGTDENAGYLLTYEYDSESLETRFLILAAGDIAGEPAATLRMPQRVPFGLHGNWIPGG